MTNRLLIRNSTAEFLIFQIEGREDGVQVVYRDESMWYTQKAMAQLSDCYTDNIGLHLKNIYHYYTGEIQPEVTVSRMGTAELIKFRGFLGS